MTNESKLEDRELFKKIKKYYLNSAIILLHTLVVFVVINILIYIGMGITGLSDGSGKKNLVIERYGKDLKKVYPDLSWKEVGQLLDETWARGKFIYEPYTQFKERPRKGKYVNVSEDGFRVSKNQGPWPLNKSEFNVFVFGGSTTFGYGLPDNQTLASDLQEKLTNRKGRKVKVYNFARGHYFSTQERILFEKLLVSGAKPDVAIFIDGLNDFTHAGQKGARFTKELTKFISKESAGTPKLIKALPINRLIKVARNSRKKSRNKKISPEKAGKIIERHREEKQSEISAAVDRYLGNKRMIKAIADAYDVSSIFVWQPVPMYKYNLENHFFLTKNLFKSLTGAGYVEFSNYVSKHSMGRNFIWCADIQEGINKPLYVDGVHYTAEMIGLVSDCVLNNATKRKLL